ncbi:methyltransferase domain-containing protein [Geomonas azotofigens]|uniref:methyltransferase domain-containing protein n=1 Tax=Geomonas azotofigens TaxID=2843196 RepID=UPI001C11C5DD|nr:methyltransferase domain-containing protein [Geomonas azotofigens]MBU5613874.1 methyltransferase domain-containing protein [Geomonas azotofigens]
MTGSTDVKEKVKEYYGKILSTKRDLKTNACCSAESLPIHQREALSLIDDEIMEKFYGCGAPIPPALAGCTVLDLGCGSGRDVYLASKLVGPDGFVIGVDMTDEQLSVARKHIAPQMSRFGYPRANVDFRKGYIEDLAACGIADNSVDVVISNCVINLSPAKERVFAEIFRVLKPGGELYFSDVFADRRLPEALKNDPVLYGECLGGALYIEDFRRLLRSLGCMDYRTVSKRAISIDNPEVAAKAGQVKFHSCTIRAFKLDCLEDLCEDFGQVAIYRGTIPELPQAFPLDDHHTFYVGKPMLVCGNSAAMVAQTRFGDHFTLWGDRSVHFGAFPCGPSHSGSPDDPCAGGSCC